MSRETGLPRRWWRFMLFQAAVFILIGILFIVRGILVVPVETLFVADGAVLISFTVTWCSVFMAIQRTARKTTAALAILACGLLMAFAALVLATLILRLRTIYV